jgi:hypothetical protein
VVSSVHFAKEVGSLSLHSAAGGGLLDIIVMYGISFVISDGGRGFPARKVKSIAIARVGHAGAWGDDLKAGPATPYGGVVRIGDGHVFIGCRGICLFLMIQMDDSRSPDRVNGHPLSPISGT